MATDKVVKRSGGVSIRTFNKSVTFANILALDSVIIPPALTTDVNNWNPTGLDECNFIRASSTTNVDITGLEKPAQINEETGEPVNQLIWFRNIGTSNIILKDNDPASDAENRFDIGGNKTIQKGEGVFLVYDRDSMRYGITGTNI